MSLAVATLVFGLCLTQVSAAAECDDAMSQGACLDASTFQWCDNGELKTANCPDGQICVTDNPWYDGAGCVATDETACGEIPSQGECTTANSVVWCDEGTPRVHPCDDDSVCGWDEASGWYDCLPTAGPAPPPDETVDASDPETEEDDSTPTEPDDLGPQNDEGVDSFADSDPVPDEVRDAPRAEVPTPTVTNDPTADEPVAPAIGCNGGGRGHKGPIFLLLMVTVVGLSRRRARSLTTA